jgi:hypothetical protein
MAALQELSWHVPELPKQREEIKQAINKVKQVASLGHGM